MKNTDVVIVGAGPSGLTAAIELAKNNVSVIVIDEFYRAGGRLLGQLYEDPYLPEENREWNGKEIAKHLTIEAENLGVTIYTNTTVWSVSESWKIEVVGAVKETIQAKALLIATGSIEKALPVPGWTLPGVYSIGAAQTFTNLHEIRIGKKVLIVGVDPLALSVMTEMNKVGIHVKSVVLPPPIEVLNNSYSPLEALDRLKEVVDLTPNSLLRQIGRLTLGRFNRLIAKSLRFNLLKVDKTALQLRKAIVRIEGKDRVEAVQLQSVSLEGKLIGKPYREEVDTVCLSGGLYPSMELAQVAGCDIVHVPELGGMVPVHGNDMSTTMPGLYVSGNITGIEGAKVAIAQGKVAAISISQYVGKKAANSLELAINEVALARKNSPLHFLPEIEHGREIMEELWKERTNGRLDRLSM